MSATSDGKQFLKSSLPVLITFVVGVVVGSTGFHSDVKDFLAALGDKAYYKFVPDQVKEVIER